MTMRTWEGRFIHPDGREVAVPRGIADIIEHRRALGLDARTVRRREESAAFELRVFRCTLRKGWIHVRVEVGVLWFRYWRLDRAVTTAIARELAGRGPGEASVLRLHEISSGLDHVSGLDAWCHEPSGPDGTRRALDYNTVKLHVVARMHGQGAGPGRVRRRAGGRPQGLRAVLDTIPILV